MKMRPLRFLHIPKAAGTTFRRILERQCLGKRQFRFTIDIKSDLERYERLPQNQRDSIAFYSGHNPIITGIDSADQATTITLLREPVSRVVSYCKYVYEGKGPYGEAGYSRDTFDMDAFLDSGYGELSNLQTKMLVNSVYSASNRVIGSMVATDAVNLALSNLNNKIACFGLQEFFDESLLLMRRRLGWRLPVYGHRNKASVSKPLKIELHHIEKIKELNQLDILLYSNARVRFLENLTSENVGNQELMRFRKINKYVGPWVDRLPIPLIMAE